ncbi:MAG: ABC transporter permease [Tissierellia bacterium]|nr:ABC transporter permease [Tissierellia bacterium]
MLKYALKRLASAFVILIVVSMITFVVLRMIPGDPAQLMLGTDASEELIETLRESMGLNRPLYEQYFLWIGGVFRGDLGKSYYFGEDVAVLISQRLPVTLWLAFFSVLTAFVLAIVLGVLSATKRGSKLDVFNRVVIALGGSIPGFWLGMMLISLFSVRLGIFPISGLDQGFLRGLLLPMIVLSMGELGTMMRIVRSSILSALQDDAMWSVRVRGLPPKIRLFKYALRSAMIQPITIAALEVGKLFGGTTIVETLFALPGVGRLLLVAVEQRDLILLQGVVLYIISVVVVISFFTDLLYAYLNRGIPEEKEVR